MKLPNQINIRNELRGGLTSAIVTLPIAIAFGQASGFGALSGIYSAICITLIGALLGGTPVQISSPVGVVLVAVIYISNQQIMLSAASLGLDPGSSEVLNHAMPYVFLIFFVSGLFQIIFGFLRIGNYINYIPYPVISGFSTGIGLLIIVLQLKDLFRLNFDSHRQFELLSSLDAEYMIRFEHAWLIVAVTLVILIFLPRLSKLVPASLVALIAASFIPYLLQWDGFRTIGPLESGDTYFNWGFFSIVDASPRMMNCLIFAVTLAVINSINTLLTSMAADHLTGMEHNSDRELIGQGISNGIAPLIGAIPGGGAIACTATNIHYGARTRYSALICGVSLILIVLFAGQVISQIPITVLDGILLYIGYLIIDKKAIKQIKIMPWMDTVIMLIVVVLTTMGELVYAVITGISLASVYFMKRMADTVELDTKLAKVDRLVNNLIDSFDNAETFRQQVLVKNIKGPIFFGFASRFSGSLKQLSGIKSLVLNMGNVSYIDQSGLYTLEREIQKLKGKEVEVYLTELDIKTKEFLLKSQLIGQLVPHTNLFPSVEECIMKLYDLTHQSPERAELSEIHIPPAFTPNQDGINDFWVISNIQKYPKCKVTIATREGDEVFNSDGYEVPWDGKVDDHYLSADKYKYKIELNDQKQRSIEGYVSIFR